MLAGLARAETVAVLPLETGAGSEETAGLGKGLAGMLMSDLSRVEALQLVERDRLQALLDEIELGSTGFLDEKTARKLGRGLGAEWLVVGSYSVLAGQFQLDARVVDGDSGQVLVAADAAGPLEDWVALEKELVDELLAGIEVQVSAKERRALMIEADTESFEAMAAYGQGLEAQDAGDAAAARAAFDKALSLDPEFESARAELAQLRALVQGTLDERERLRLEQADARIQGVLSAVPPQRDPSDPQQAVDFAVRSQALHAAGLHCTRAEELRAWLEASDWELVEPQYPDKVYGFAIGQRWEELAGQGSRPPGFPRYTTGDVVAPQRPTAWPREVGNTLVDSLTQCHEGQAAVDAVEELRAAVRAGGVSSALVSHDRTGLSLDDRLLVSSILLHARVSGGDAQLKSWLEDLLGRHEPDSTARGILESYVEDALRLAEEHGARQTVRLGFSDEELERVMRAVAASDKSVLSLQSTTCSWIADNDKARATSWVALYDQALAEGNDNMVQHRLDEASFTLAPLRDWGCLGGEPVFEDVYEAYAWSREAVKLPPLKPQDASCAQQIVQLEQLKLDERLINEAGEAYVAFAGWVPVMQTWNLVRLGCIPAPERK